MAMTLSKPRFGGLATGRVTPFASVAGAGRLLAKQAAADDEMSQLDAMSARIRYDRNETIFSEGDPAEFVYKVLDGAVRLCKHTVDGRRQVLDFMMPGDLFGFVDHEYGFTAEAINDAVLVVYPRNQLDRLGATTPSLRQHVLSLVSESLRAMQHHVVVLGCQTAKERVASFLLRQAERARLASGEPLELPMGRQDLADHLGLTIETVCRAIADLRRDKVIAIPNTRHILLNSIGLLRAVTEGTAAA